MPQRHTCKEIIQEGKVNKWFLLLTENENGETDKEGLAKHNIKMCRISAHFKLMNLIWFKNN